MWAHKYGSIINVHYVSDLILSIDILVNQTPYTSLSKLNPF